MLRAGASTNVFDDRCQTPVMAGAKLARADALKVLLCSERCEVSLEAKDRDGRTALAIAVLGQGWCRRGSVSDTVQLLLDHGADPAVVVPGELHVHLWLWSSDLKRLLDDAAAAGPERVQMQRGWHRQRRRLRLVLWHRAATGSRGLLG